MDKTAILRRADKKVELREGVTMTWFVSKELGNSDAVTLAQGTVKPGFVSRPHFHPNCEELVHIMQGKMLHNVEGGRKVELSEGDTISIPANVLHNAENIGDVEAVLMICLSSVEPQTVRE